MVFHMPILIHMETEGVSGRVPRMRRILSIWLFLFMSVVLPASSPAMGTLPVPGGDWKEIFRRNGIIVFSQETSGSEILGFRAVGILHARIEQVMEVLRKVEITHEWMPNTQERYILEDVSDLEAVTYSINSLPWPFADRELVLHNQLRLDRESKCLVVDVRSVASIIAPRNAHTVRAQMHCGRTFLRPAGPGRTEVDLNIRVDPVGRIPAWLVNLTQRTLPYDFLRALEKKAAQTDYPLRPTFRRMVDDLRHLLDRSDSVPNGS